jgi:hypothetical protein
MTALRTANQILSHFKSHPGVRVIRNCGIYEVWSVKDGQLEGRQAQYDISELKIWAARW